MLKRQFHLIFGAPFGSLTNGTGQIIVKPTPFLMQQNAQAMGLAQASHRMAQRAKPIKSDVMCRGQNPIACWLSHRFWLIQDAVHSRHRNARGRCKIRNGGAPRRHKNLISSQIHANLILFGMKISEM
jgi:hypothetical protein